MLPEEEGLTSAEAKKRLEKFGANTLPERPPPSDFVIVLSQLKNPLVYILIIAGIVTLLLNHRPDSVIIFLAVFINTILGFFQERRASRALYALKQLIHPKARVLRDGELKTIDVTEVVPGDIVILSQGDKVPADGKLLKANRFFVSEAVLTGESVAVRKKKDDTAFMGTIVTSGKARMQVELTGAKTEIGKIAESIQRPVEETPLRKQLIKLSRQLAILVLFLTGFVFAAGLLTGKGILEIFTTSVALAVSAIPEGLLVGLTVVLAIGMQRILRQKGLVRNLVSAETLGGVTTICIDKTGTLTEGEMKVVGVLGEKKNIARQGILANDLDDPLVIALWEWANKKVKSPKNLIKRHMRLDSIPFSPKQRFFASLNKWEEERNVIFVNGAPEFLIEWSNLKREEKISLRKEVEKLTSEGKRLIGMAKKEVPSSKKRLSIKDVKSGLSWVGLVSFSDPVRSGVRQALKKTEAAGIKVLVITGDYPETAASVVKDLGMTISPEQIVLGETLERITIATLAKRLADIKLFARTTPAQKLKIVEALKKNGEVVAMMGDGVNDAPALNRADIGIVVGEASDVAKETADLVLLDSNFTTIVSAIEEGRGIYDNVRKIILYLMSDAFEEIIAVTGTIILGLPLPVTAAQILWINLVSDGFPDLALTVDPKAPGIMRRKPRPSSEMLVSSWMRLLILAVSLVGGVLALILFAFFYSTTGNLELSRSVAFATLGVNSLVYVFSIRTLTDPFWRESPLDNKWLNVAVIAGLLLQFTPFATKGIRDFFGLAPLGLTHLFLIFSASALMFIIIEVTKALFRRHVEWFRH